VNNIGTPRIYVDYISWLHALGWNMHPFNIGIGFNIGNIYTTEISSIQSKDVAHFGGSSSSGEHTEGLYLPKGLKYNFSAVLGHNFSGMKFQVGSHRYDADTGGYIQCRPDKQDIINCGEITGTANTPSYDGFTIMEFIDNNEFNINGNESDILKWFLYSSNTYENPTHTWKLGAWAIGSFYDFPNAADLQLTQTYEMDGITHQTTKGGVRLSDVKYRGNPKWGELGAWELDDSYGGAQLNARSGRRSWDLSFSYISDTDMFPTVSSGAGILPESLGDNLIVNGNMEVDDNWADQSEPSTNVQSGDQKHSGSYSRLFVPSSSSDGIVSDSFQVDAGATYLVSAWVYPDAGTSVKVKFVDGGSNPTSIHRGGLVQDTWNLITESFTAISSGSGTLAFMNSGSETTGNWYIDDVILQKLSLEDDNLLGGDDFVSAVWNRTLGGRLSFIFQPDKDNNNNFAICKFDQDTLDIQRVAPNTYTIKLKIREVF